MTLSDQQITTTTLDYYGGVTNHYFPNVASLRGISIQNWMRLGQHCPRPIFNMSSALSQPDVWEDDTGGDKSQLEEIIITTNVTLYLVT